MKQYEFPKARLLRLGNDLLTASAEQNEPPEPCKCYSFPTYGVGGSEDECSREDQWGGFETRSGI